MGENEGPVTFLLDPKSDLAPKEGTPESKRKTNVAEQSLEIVANPLITKPLMSKENILVTSSPGPNSTGLVIEEGKSESIGQINGADRSQTPKPPPPPTAEKPARPRGSRNCNEQTSSPDPSSAGFPPEDAKIKSLAVNPLRDRGDIKRNSAVKAKATLKRISKWENMENEKESGKKKKYKNKKNKRCESCPYRCESQLQLNRHVAYHHWNIRPATFL